MEACLWSLKNHVSDVISEMDVRKKGKNQEDIGKRTSFFRF